MLMLQLNETSPSLAAAVGDWRTELAKAQAELAAAIAQLAAIQKLRQKR